MSQASLEPDFSDSALKINLNDLFHFIKWIHHANQAFDNGKALPAVPKLESGKVQSWIHLIQKYEIRLKQQEEQSRDLTKNIQSQETDLRRLLSDLHTNIASLYDNLGFEEKAHESRMKAEQLYSQE